LTVLLQQAATYEFTSREVKQLAFRLDGLFLPTTKEPEKPIYMVEVQFQPDENLYYRLFGELFLYLRQYKPRHRKASCRHLSSVEFLLGTNPDNVQTPDSPLNKLTLQNAIGQSSL